LPGETQTLRTRGITYETCRKFNVRYDDTTRSLIFPFYTPEGSLCAYKKRSVDKDFVMVGKNAAKTFFGQQLFGGGKAIVITEGEIDAMSVWEARPNWPVVSVPNGADSAIKAVQSQMKWLLEFDEITLFFDNDEHGQKAAIACASILPSDRVFIAKTDQFKDANEAFKVNPEYVRQAIWNKKAYHPEHVVAGTDLYELARSPSTGRDADWPYSQLDSVTSGLRLGELVTVTAGTGIGKSTFAGEVAASLIAQGQMVGYVALEESLKRTAQRLMSVHANKPLHINNDIPQEEFDAAYKSTVGSGLLFLRSGFGSVDPEPLLNDLRYMVNSIGCKWLFVDHLSILLSGNDSGDERKLIDVTMTRLRSFVEETGCGMILISHLRRPPEGKGHEAGGKVHLGQLRGSHAIVQLSDIVVALERNLEDGENSAALKVLKNRHSGITGAAGSVRYDSETGRMTENFFGPTPHTTTDTPF
jgi:twinkle protein